MKMSLLVAAVPLLAVNGFANVSYKNYSGGNMDFWHSLRNPNTATYGQTFSGPVGPNSVLTGFGFYLGNPYSAGAIKLDAHIGTWTGKAEVGYANTAQTILPSTPAGWTRLAAATPEPCLYIPTVLGGLLLVAAKTSQRRHAPSGTRPSAE